MKTDEGCHLGTLVELSLPLDEAGGLVSWGRRWLTNVDPNVAEQLEEALSGVRTESDRAELLKEVDYFLSEASAAKNRGSVGDALPAVLMVPTLDRVGGVGGAWAGALERLAAARAPLLAKAVWWVSPLLSLLGAASLSVAVLGIVLRTVYRHNGRLDDYISALLALREKVSSMRPAGT